MAHQSALIAKDILGYLKSQEEKSLLRFITCGSVDDGKSTLIGRLLWDSKLIFEDQLAALEVDSKRVGTQGGAIDYALLLDGLQAEREQGITIDVAYRYFSTERRKFIVADTPGHEQYTRNMVTAASTAQAAVILIDARRGILTQTRRHSYLVSLVGIRRVVLAVNKMDLVDYDPQRFHAICREYRFFAEKLGFEEISAIPISALKGDNVIETSRRTGWYRGPTLMEYLEGVPVAQEDGNQPFRFPVQWVNRPDLDFRGFCGTVASGTVRPGDEIAVSSSGKTSRVARIVTMDGDLSVARTGQAVTLTLADEIDISRGDLLAPPKAPPLCSDRIRAQLVWLNEESLKTGASYLLKGGTGTTPARVAALEFRVNVNTLEKEPGEALSLNEIGVGLLELDRAFAFDPYQEISGTGSFILIDRYTNATVAAGMFLGPEASETSGTLEPLPRREKAPSPGIYWLYGSSEQASQAAAQNLAVELNRTGNRSYLLDADALKGLNRDLAGETLSDGEALRRAAEVARLLTDAGVTVLMTTTRPTPAHKELVREILDDRRLVEIPALNVR